MRRQGVLAVGLAALIALPAMIAAGPLQQADAAEGQAVSATLVMSRAHELLTVVVRNDGASWSCIDPAYAAPGRLQAYARDGHPIRDAAPAEIASRAACTTLGPGRAVHAVYDLRPLYPVGLPGFSRICYSSWWKRGGVASLAPNVRISRCLSLSRGGFGRR